MDAYFKLTGYAPSTILESPSCCYKHLKITKFLLKHVVDAIENFYIKKNYILFDAHVGDAMCQIRALKLLELTTTPVAKSYITRIHTLITKIDLWHNQCPQKNKKRFKSKALTDFFSDIEISLDISNDIEFLTKCYLLTIYKKFFHHFDARIETAKLQEELNIGKTSAERIVRHLQTSLAELSVGYIKEIMTKNPIILEKLLAHDLNRRPILPCYFLTTILLERLKQLNCNILVIVRENKSKVSLSPRILLFTYQSSTNNYELQPEMLLNNQPYFILNCYSNLLGAINKKRYQLKLQSLGVENLFLYCSAHHIQYSPNSLTQKNISCYRNLLTDKYIVNNKNLLLFVNRLLNNYEDASIKHGEFLLDDSQGYICEIEHISMGTLNDHNIIYNELGFGAVVINDSIEAIANES